MPLRPWNRKKKREQPQPPDHKSCSSPVNLSSASSLTQSSSYSTCTGSLASSTQTKTSAEPPGWVHNPPPPCTLDQEIADDRRIVKENNVPMRNGCPYPPSNALRRQWVRQGVPSPVRIRSQQPMQSNNIPSYQRQSMARMCSDNTLQMTYSESSEGSSISSVTRDTLGPIWLNTESNDEQQRLRNAPITLPGRSVDIENQVSIQRAYSREECANITVDSTEQRMEVAVRSTQTIEAHFASPGKDEAEESHLHSSAALLDMGRMQDIYASMMVAFKKKIMKELREEMQKEMHHQLSALKTEINEMNIRLMELEKCHATNSS